MNNYDEQILELKRRIEVLEKAENKRIRKRKMEIAFGIGKFLLVIILLLLGYVYIYGNYMKPYKEKIDFVENKINSVEDFVSDKWDLINKYNPFA